MSTNRLTMSLCPACYAPIPAMVTSTEGGVIMAKECKKHGGFTSLVEKDPRWYEYCRSVKSPKIYDGYFIDVTDRCNLQCKYCYHRGGGEDRKSGDIIKEAIENRILAPFLLTGGEPTMHPELPVIVKQLCSIGETWVLTNGVGVTPSYLQKIEGAKLALSLHSESADSYLRVLEYCRSKGIKVGSVQYTIDSLPQIDKALGLYSFFKDTIEIMKIKAVSNLWREKRVKRQLFVSDMLNYLREKGEVKISPELPQKVSFATVQHKGLLLNLVSWYNVENVDLQDIDCAPYYRSKDGVVRDFVTACLVNEGMEEEVDGVRARRAVHNDVEEVSYLWERFVKEEDSGNTPNRVAWVQQTHEAINHSNYYLLVAEKGGKIVGFQDGLVQLDPTVNKMCIFGRHFYVLPEHRGGQATKGLNDLTLRLGKLAGVTDVLRPITPRLMEYWEKKGCKVTNIIVRTGFVGG